MTPQQIQQLDRRLQNWRETHQDPTSLRTAYRQKVLEFTLNSMAMECEPVDPERLRLLLNRPGR